jgi:hypothetical protein
VTSLVVALSLVVGILVSDLAGSRLLTAAHARSGCAGQGGNVNITQGVLTGGLLLHDIVVGGQLVPVAYVPGSVQVTRGTITNADGIIVSDGRPDGIIVSDGGPSDPTGIIVSDGGPGSGIEADGIIVSDGGPCMSDGIIVSDGGGITATGIIVSDGGGITATGIIVSDGISVTAAGGTLSGDGISVENGVVTGGNLRLTGASISGGSMKFNGVVTSVRVPPTN